MTNLSLVKQDLVSPGVKRSEKRFYPRATCDFSLQDGRGLQYQCSDISVGGLKYITFEPLVDNVSPFFITFPKCDVTIKLPGETKWRKEVSKSIPGSQVGVRFTDVSEPDRRRLQFLVNSLAQGTRFTEVLFKPQSLVNRSDELSKLVEKIEGHKLSQLILECAEECGKISKRPFYLWQWCHEGLLRTTFSCVSPKWFNSVITAKLYSVIFTTVMDDLADQIKDKEFHSQVLAHVFNLAPSPSGHLEKERRHSVRTLKEMWRFIENYIQSFPRYSEFKDLFYFDYATLMHHTKYALLINKQPEAISEKEEMIEQASVHIMINATLDLMCSETFDVKELGILRGIVLEAQDMCRIANWLATWEREINASDYTSGVIAVALNKGIISLNQLQDTSVREQVIKKIKESDVEANLMASWEKHWNNIQSKKHEMVSVDVEGYLEGIEAFYRNQMASKSMV